MSPRPIEVASDVSFVDAVIASGGSLSTVANLGGMNPVGIIVTGDWTNAGISFEGKGPGSENYYPLHDKDTGIPIAVAVGGALTSTPRWYPLDPSVFAGVNALKVRSGTLAAPVVQAAARTLRIVCRKI